MSELMCSQSKCRRKDEHIAELKAELAVLKRERDDFKDSMEYWELQYRGKGADLTALRVAAQQIAKKPYLMAAGPPNDNVMVKRSLMDELAAALQEEVE